MSNLTIEVCKDRAAAEARKKQIKDGAPGTTYKTRIVEDIESVAMFLTNGGSTQLLGEAYGSDLNVDHMAILVIWTD